MKIRSLMMVLMIALLAMGVFGGCTKEKKPPAESRFKSKEPSTKVHKVSRVHDLPSPKNKSTKIHAGQSAKPSITDSDMVGDGKEIADQPLPVAKCDQFCGDYCPKMQKLNCRYEKGEAGLSKCRAECRRLCRRGKISMEVPHCLNNMDCDRIVACLKKLIPTEPNTGKK